MVFFLFRITIVTANPVGQMTCSSKLVFLAQQLPTRRLVAGNHTRIVPKTPSPDDVFLNQKFLAFAAAKCNYILFFVLPALVNTNNFIRNKIKNFFWK